MSYHLVPVPVLDPVSVGAGRASCSSKARAHATKRVAWVHVSKILLEACLATFLVLNSVIVIMFLHAVVTVVASSLLELATLNFLIIFVLSNFDLARSHSIARM